MNLRVLIVEDEEATAKRTTSMLAQIEPTAVIVGITDSIEATINWFNENPQPDLVLMDIQLADGSSFQIFNQIKVHCPVIFTTAYDEFALQAFKVNSIDYLLKPLKINEFENALIKLKSLNKKQTDIDYSELARLLQSKQQHYLSRLMLKVGSQIKVFETTAVAYFYITERIVFAKLKTGERYPVDFTLDQLEQELDPQLFFRINRSFLISFGSIDKLYTYSKSRIKLILNPICESEAISSTERSPLFRSWLSGQNN